MVRRGFTLVELLIVITIIGIIAALSMAALMGAAEDGRRARARAQVAKLDQLISEKWNSYRFRQMPVRIPAKSRPVFSNRIRLDVMRELQRLEMPDRLTDILDDPISPVPAIQDPTAGGILPQPLPAVTRSYRRKVTPLAASRLSYDQAEMLYLIIADMRDGDKSALGYFMNSEIGDLDDDGMYELLDPWGQPIMFLRWAPGHSKATVSDAELAGKVNPPAPQIDVAVSTFQLPDGLTKADTFDPLKADPRWGTGDNSGFKPFQLRPLIFSGGQDKVYDIYTDTGTGTHHASLTSPPNDPYAMPGTNGLWLGTPYDVAGDGLDHGDNITNHAIEIEGE